MLDITCGLAGWRLAAAAPLESPDDSAGSGGARLTFRLAGGLAQLTLLLRAPGDAHEQILLWFVSKIQIIVGQFVNQHAVWCPVASWPQLLALAVHCCAALLAADTLANWCRMCCRGCGRRKLQLPGGGRGCRRRAAAAAWPRRSRHWRRSRGCAAVDKASSETHQGHAFPILTDWELLWLHPALLRPRATAGLQYWNTAILPHVVSRLLS